MLWNRHELAVKVGGKLCVCPRNGRLQALQSVVETLGKLGVIQEGK